MVGSLVNSSTRGSVVSRNTTAKLGPMCETLGGGVRLPVVVVVVVLVLVEAGRV